MGYARVMRRAAFYGALAVLFAALAHLGLSLTSGDGRIAAVWLPNAFMIAILARRRRFEPGVLPVIFAANLAVNLTGGDPWWQGSLLAAANVAEIAVACLAMRRVGLVAPRMDDVHDLLRFLLIAGCLAPLVSAFIAAVTLGGSPAEFAAKFAMWWLTDSLSIVLITPCVWILADGITGRLQPERRSAFEWCAILAGVAIVSVLVFGQSQYPLLFLIAPAVIVSAFRLGSLGSALATLIVAVIAMVFTAASRGPITLIGGGVIEELIVLQIFIAANFAMCLPVALVLSNMRRVTTELVSSERRFQALSDLSPAGIFRTDAAGLATYVNKAWQDMAGLDDGHWKADGWADALHPADRDKVFAAWVSAVEVGGPFEQDFRFQHRSGHTSWVHALGQPEFDDQGAVAGYVGVVIDITSVKQLVDDLEVSKQEAQAAAQAKSAFLANMSHEIRTPMNGVLGFTELLLSGPLADDQRVKVEMIAESGRIMLSLLNDILDISKIETGNMQLAEESFDVRHKARSVANALRPLALAKGLTLDVAIEDDVPPCIRGDRLRLRQVLMNLVGNAIKFTERGRVGIHLACRDPGGRDPRLIMSVNDTGIGIPADRLETVFDSFIQADSSVARKFGGSGLGLAISHQLVELMGGSITVASTVGEGSSFTIDVPLRIGDPAEIQPRSKPRGLAAPVDFRNGRAPRVLIAEDNEINRLLMRSIAERTGVELEIAPDGRQALQAVEDAAKAGNPFDIVFMDMQMPEMDGLTATRILRESPFGRDLPIVALTANAYDEDVGASRAAGMQAHLAKPVSLEDFVATIETYAAHGKQPEEALRATLGAGPAGSGEDGAEADEEIAGIAKLYCERKAGLFALMTAIEASGRIETEQAPHVVSELHKLAGTAGFFGEQALGDRARELENRLSGSDPSDYPALIAEACAAWAEIRAAGVAAGR